MVGSGACGNLEKTTKDLLERLRLRIEATELAHPDGRVVVFSVPPRPIGMPIPVDGAYWMRAGESLVAMTPDQLKRIFDEGVPDFSASICAGATVADLSSDAIERFRTLAAVRQPTVAGRPTDRLLEDAELTINGRVTYAALILLGTRRALGVHLANAEVIYEYRIDDAAVAYAQREDLREGLLLIDDTLWRAIQQHNTLHQFVDGFFRRDIPSFNERAVREAVLNAVCHRDYRLQGSVFVRQRPSRLEITSPGGFPPGITVDNILFRQSPRNRRLAEALARCGMVERSGQGADLLFATAVQEGKQPFDYSDSDEFQVKLTLHGAVEDEGFLRFLEKATSDAGRPLTTHDLVVLNAVHRDRPVPDAAKVAIGDLIDRGLIERAAKRRLVLARKYHRLVGRPGDYTRKAGLDRPTQKALIVKHIRENPGSPLGDLCQVLPNLTAKQVQTLLADLKRDGSVRSEGKTKAGRWFLV